MSICQEAIDLIVVCEVTSQAFYERHHSRPTWPGGDSGLTIGIGFDLGYGTPGGIDRDWPMLPEDARARLKAVAGLKGAKAQAALPMVRDIIVPWTAAVDSFRTATLPRYVEQTLAAFPAADTLPPLCLGALVSLVYNRGASCNGERRTEMAAIRDLIRAGKLTDVPAQLRAMKRLWPTVKGLRDRREKEAQLWETGNGHA